MSTITGKSPDKRPVYRVRGNGGLATASSAGKEGGHPINTVRGKNMPVTVSGTPGQLKTYKNAHPWYGIHVIVMPVSGKNEKVPDDAALGGVLEEAPRKRFCHRHYPFWLGSTGPGR